MTNTKEESLFIRLMFMHAVIDKKLKGGKVMEYVTKACDDQNIKYDAASLTKAISKVGKLEKIWHQY